MTLKELHDETGMLLAQGADPSAEVWHTGRPSWKPIVAVEHMNPDSSISANPQKGETVPLIVLNPLSK